MNIFGWPVILLTTDSAVLLSFKILFEGLKQIPKGPFLNLRKEVLEPTASAGGPSQNKPHPFLGDIGVVAETKRQ